MHNCIICHVAISHAFTAATHCDMPDSSLILLRTVLQYHMQRYLSSMRD